MGVFIPVLMGAGVVLSAVYAVLAPRRYTVETRIVPGSVLESPGIASAVNNAIAIGVTQDWTWEIPLLIVGGSEDRTAPFPDNDQPPYDLANPPKFLVELIGEGHTPETEGTNTARGPRSMSGQPLRPSLRKRSNNKSLPTGSNAVIPRL